MLTVRVEAPRLRDAIGRFARVTEVAEEELTAATARATELVYDQARRNVRATFNNPGRMESALRMTVRPGKVPVGEVSVDGVENVVHELGGARSYLILPRNRLALKFGAGLHGGGSTFAASAVRGPVKRRSYLRLALEQRRSQVRELYAAAARAIAQRTAGA